LARRVRRGVVSDGDIEVIKEVLIEEDEPTGVLWKVRSGRRSDVRFGDGGSRGNNGGRDLTTVVGDPISDLPREATDVSRGNWSKGEIRSDEMIGLGRSSESELEVTGSCTLAARNPSSVLLILALLTFNGHESIEKRHVCEMMNGPLVRVKDRNKRPRLAGYLS
jgi:hypothetical protein